MEQLIPYSCHSLYFYGLDLLYKSNFHKFTFRAIFIALVIGNIVASAQRMQKYPKHSPIDFACLFITVGAAFASWKVWTTFSRVKRLFSVIAPHLSEAESKCIKKYDRRLTLLQLFIFAASVASITGYTYVYGNMEIISFICGTSPPNGTSLDPIKELYYDIMGYVVPFPIYFVYMAFWNCAIFYILVLLLIKNFALNCNNFMADIRYENEEVFKKTMNRYKLFNFTVIEVNDLLAIIPFLMLAFKFVALVAAFSYSTIYDSEFSITFMINNWGLILPFTLTLLQFAIHFSCDSLEIMEQFRSDAIKLLELNYSPNLTGVYAPCLKMFFEIEQVTPVSVGNLFDMNRNLLLSFADAALPFTIMIVTSTTAISASKVSLRTNPMLNQTMN